MIEAAVITPEKKTGSARLMLRWPDRRDELSRAAAMDKSVADIFASYQQASKALVYWSRQTQPGSIDIANDYRRILTELERDLVDMMARHSHS